MSQLLKLTKKSCLKIYRKFAPLKPLSAKKLEEEDEIFNDNHVVALQYEETPDLPSHQPPENEINTKSQDLNENETVQDFETSSAYEAEVENLNLTDLENNRMLQCLTSRLFSTSDGYEFKRLEQLRSDTTSDIVQNEPEFAAFEIVFEKVKYNKHVRYFRRTPSSLSLDDFNDNAHNVNSLNADQLTDAAKQAGKATAIQLSCNCSDNHQPPTVQSIPQYMPTYVPMNVMNLEIKNPGKYESVVIAEQRDRFDKLMPIVKWDINGNSLDDDFYVDDSWNEYADMNWNNRNREKRVSQFKLDAESQKSSFRSSSTTLETWLDEDLLGSSFNERRQVATTPCRPKV